MVPNVEDKPNRSRLPPHHAPRDGRWSRARTFGLATVRPMEATDRQRLCREDARILGQIGALLAETELPKVTVRLSSALARAAVEAWRREDEDEPDKESAEQRVARRRAGTLALIGLALEEGGRDEGDFVLVDLSPDLIGFAVDAADDLPT
jgi:hypothetical protein